MKKVKNFVLGGLQQKIFNLVLITIILILAAYSAVLSYHTNNLIELVNSTSLEQEESIDEISTKAMETVIRESLGTTTELEAYIADEFFDDLAKSVTILGDYAENLFSDPESFGKVKVLPPDAAKDGEISMQLLTEEGVDITDPDIEAHIQLIGNMEDLMTVSVENAQVDSCFIASPDGFMVLSDRNSGGKLTESGEPENIPVRERPWYVGAAESGKIYFTDIEKDTFTDRIGIVCALPVYADGELVAVAGADLFLDSMEQAVEGSTDDYGSFDFIVDQNGHVIFAPESQQIFAVKTSDQAEDLRQSAYPELAEFIADALNGPKEVQLIHMGDEAYYMAGAPMKTVGWSVISVVDQKAAQEPTVRMREQYQEINQKAIESYNDSFARSRNVLFLLLFVIVAAGIVAAMLVARKIVKPLNQITERISQLSGDNLQFKMEDEYRTGDEVEVLAESFSDLSAKTVRYMEQIKQVTAEKERIGTELEMAKAIQASQLPHLFPAFPDRPEFDVYASMAPAREVGGDFYDFFLVDDDHIGLVIADVAGKGVPAALFMMVSRLLIRNRIQSGESPAMALKNVNNQIVEGNEAGMFVTVWLAVLEISTGKAVVSNAGHEHPVVRRAGGEYELVKYHHSPAVGFSPDLVYEEHDFEMHPGDSFFVYTDGVAEAENREHELFGTGRLLKTLNRDPDAMPEGILNNVKADIASFAEETEQFDDITMMCMKYIGPDPDAASK